MAKKKVSQTHQDKPLPNQETFIQPHQQPASIDSEASEKLENLKSLNQILVKESFERRQQVETLIQSNGHTESELITANSERYALRSELTLLGEKAARLELERNVVDVFVNTQVAENVEVTGREMKILEIQVKKLKGVIDEKESDIGKLNGKLKKIETLLENEREVSNRACKEIDDLKGEMEVGIAEVKGLREKLIKLDELKKEMEHEIEELRCAYDATVQEKADRERGIESIMGEKDLMERSLMNLSKLMEETKEELLTIHREKEGIEEEKNLEIVKRHELENEVSRLNEMVVSLQKEEHKLLLILAELEKKCIEDVEKQKDMVKEIDQLVEEKKSSEKRFDVLIANKSDIEDDLEKSVKQLDEYLHKIDDLVNENTVLLESKGRLESETVTLQNQLSELKTMILKLEDSSRVEVIKIKSLDSEVGDYKCKLEQANVESEELKNCLAEEKRNSIGLKKHIELLEKKMEEALKVANDVKAENGELSIQKIELQGQCENMKKEITYLEKRLTEDRNGFDSMKSRVELTEANLELVVNMLKDSAAFCSKFEKDKIVYGEEVNPCVIDFETIKNAFKSKDAKEENLKKQLQVLEISVKEAEKKKGLWAALSSATTLAAAIFVAYVARGH